MKMNYFVLPGLVGIKNLRIESIKNIVLEYLGVTFEEIRGSKRDRKYSNARKILAYFINRYAGKISSVALGQYINKNHATILYYFRKVDEFRTYEPDFREVMEQIDYRINQFNETI